MEDKKLFPPNYEEHLFTITVKVFKNCNSIQIEGVNGYLPTYHESIGALEITKGGLLYDQREANRKAFKKAKKNQP
jgi:hypothetical protein